MNYDPECRKATRRKINVVLPCTVIRGDERARVASEKAWAAPRPASPSADCGVAVAAFKGGGEEVVVIIILTVNSISDYIRCSAAAREQ